jgi:hypothetical protein
MMNKGGIHVTISPITAAISTPTIIMIIILAALVAGVIVLYIVSSRQQKKSEEALAQIKAAAIPQTMLILDKKRVRAIDAQLPKVVIDNMPRMARRSKLPIVKAKVGSTVRNFMCDADVFEILPVKQEVKAMVGGIYIVSIKPLRGQTLPRPAKKGFFKRLLGR